MSIELQIAGTRAEDVPREGRSLRPSLGVQLAELGDGHLTHLAAYPHGR